MRRWFIFIFIFITLFSCNNNLRKPLETSKSDILCITPPPEVYTSDIEASLDASAGKLKNIAEANISIKQKVEKIRETFKGIHSFEILEFRFCVMYINGLVDKEKYNELIDKVLPLLLKTGERLGDVTSEDTTKTDKHRPAAIKIKGGKNIIIKDNLVVGDMGLLDAENVENIEVDNNVLIPPEDAKKK